jgi:hypothetical protein
VNNVIYDEQEPIEDQIDLSNSLTTGAINSVMMEHNVLFIVDGQFNTKDRNKLTLTLTGSEHRCSYSFTRTTTYSDVQYHSSP